MKNNAEMCRYLAHLSIILVSCTKIERQDEFKLIQFASVGRNIWKCGNKYVNLRQNY